MEQIPSYLEQKKKENNLKIVPYFYFLIIRFEEFKENLEKLLILSFESGITFLVFLYMEKGDTTKFYKNQFNFPIPTILVYSAEDILNYLSQKLNFFNPLNLPDLKELLNIKIPKITFEQSAEGKYQGGCFELTETFDVDLVKNKFLLCLNHNTDYRTEFSINIYNIYKEHNALDLFYSQNCLYFGWSLYPELLCSSNICFSKRILYMYCREEEQSQKSFYRIVNDDLRSGDPYKIYRYISILALISQLIENEFLESFKGKVYRATRLDENFIMKLIPGVKLVNTIFWSTTKDLKIAESFMIKKDFTNSLIICKTHKNNIDIDFEKLNRFNEKEVLFLPFNEFIVDKVSYKTKYGKKVFTIELTELGNRYFLNPDNMRIEDINKFSVKNAVEKYYKKNGINMEKLIFKNFKFNNQNKN